MRTDIDIDIFKKKLLDEKDQILEQLQRIGTKNPQNEADWVATGGDVNRGETDPINKADNFEELENNTAIVGDLEGRLLNINDALSRIESGTYGYCEISHEPIEIDRLEANPAAKTCKAHMND